jgi:hypothetical protein
LNNINSTALARIAVAVVVERREAKSPWLEFIWRPVAVLAGSPEAAPWTLLREEEGATLFYAGDTVVELYRTETENYRSNLASGAPSLWVILRSDRSRGGYELLAVTADPAEGEAFAGPGTDLVEAVPMPTLVAATIGDFIAEHHVERPFVKRRRARAEAQPPGQSGDDGSDE